MHVQKQIRSKSSQMHKHLKHNTTQQTDGDDSQKSLHVLRQFYCSICRKINDCKNGRFMDKTIYCKTCAQAMCMAHIPDLYPLTYGKKEKQKWDEWSLGDRINASGKCCKADDVSQVTYIVHLLFQSINLCLMCSD